MKIKHNHYKAFYDEDPKLPRKSKKYFLGRYLTNKELRHLLNTMVVGASVKTMYDRCEILPYPFCPKCGCKDYIGCGNKTSYPDHWEEYRCIRCKNIVGYIDNSPFIHALECKSNNYSPIL